MRQELDGEFHFTSAENRRLAQELQFHVDTTTRLTQHQEKMQHTLKTLKLELALAKEKDEYVCVCACVCAAKGRSDGRRW